MQNFLRLVKKAFSLFRQKGFYYTFAKFLNKLRIVRSNSLLARRPLFTREELSAQRSHTFPISFKISIIVPLYNTPSRFLRDMLKSVLAQTYSNWELCLADGSDNAHKSVSEICLSYAKKDSRIKYKKLEKNMGISENSNACLRIATGDYIALLDHDDLIHPATLHEVMHAISNQNADFIYTDENTFSRSPRDAFMPHFKPDYAPDTLRSYNYICHFTVFSRSLLNTIGTPFRSEFDGSQDYDLVLRLTENAQKIVHIPKILYYWRAHAGSVAFDLSAKQYTLSAAKSALSSHLRRIGLDGKIVDSTHPSTYRVQYRISGCPMISILIPNKDHVDDLEKCINSIISLTTHQNWEIVIIENNSTSPETFNYYQTIQHDHRIRVITWNFEFNFSAINNFGAANARGEYLLFLNNDTQVITPDWIEQMLMFAQRNDVGAVGAMLYYPDNTVQHAGVILGIGGFAGHAHKYFPRGDIGYMARMSVAQNYSAVTAACMLVSKSVFNQVNGFDQAFKVALNDIDLCMRIRSQGLLVVWTPYAELYHHESKSRGDDTSPEARARFLEEIRHFNERWHGELIAGDPYYNPNLTLDGEDFSLK